MPIPSPPSSVPSVPSSPGTTSHGPHKLILCADGGGSKVCVVVRARDGTEKRGYAGPCNVQSVGHIPAADRILEATYKALAQFPASYLPADFAVPAWQQSIMPNEVKDAMYSRFNSPAPSGYNTPRVRPPPLSHRMFSMCWIALAGFTTKEDTEAFMPFITAALNTSSDRMTLTNDVNLLAGPALHLSGIEHAIAVVCGTGTIGHTIRVGARHDLPPSPPVEMRTVSSESSGDSGDEMHGVTDVNGNEVNGANGTNGTEAKAANGATDSTELQEPATVTKSKHKRGLPLEDIGVSRGWGYMLCDEGSAFWIGRLAVRFLLGQWDREHSAGMFSTPTPAKLPLHEDLLAYFDVADPTELIGIVALMGPSFAGLTTGEAASKRNAYIAGAARVVFRWAFPADSEVDLDTPAARASHEQALGIATDAIKPMVRLVLETLGDGSIVHPARSALCLGGGLMNSPGYRGLLLDGCASEGVQFKDVLLVDDAAGEGAKALGAVAFE